MSHWLTCEVRLERSLYERANGYNYNAVKVFVRLVLPAFVEVGTPHRLSDK